MSEIKELREMMERHSKESQASILEIKLSLARIEVHTDNLKKTTSQNEKDIVRLKANYNKGVGFFAAFSILATLLVEWLKTLFRNGGH